MKESLDSRSLRHVATIAIVPMILAVYLSGTWTGWSWLAATFGLALSVYFGHLLFRRIQCSLLEWFTVMVLLASAVGLTLSAPGMLRAPAVVALIVPLLIAWIFFAAIRAVVSAELLKLESPPLRMTWILLHAWLLISRALLVTGGAIYAGSAMPWMSGSDFTPYGVPLAMIGLIGLIFDFVVHRRVKRAVKMTLAAESYAASKRSNLQTPSL